MEKTTKVASKIGYTKGNILHCETTGKNYEVLECKRIRLFDEKPNFGLVLKELTSQNVYIN